MDAVEFGWIAGIVDGEGCITITRQRPGRAGRVNWSYRLFVKVTMGHRPTIDRISALVGTGSIHEQRSNKGHNTAWSWIVAGREAGTLIRTLRPVLFTKAAEADLAIEFDSLPLAPRGGRRGGNPVPPELLSERHRLFCELRDIKPSARFRNRALSAQAP